MVYRTFFGEITDEANAEMKDLNGREIGLLMPLVVLMVWMGMGPAPFLGASSEVRRPVDTSIAKADRGGRRTRQVSAVVVRRVAPRAAVATTLVPPASSAATPSRPGDLGRGRGYRGRIPHGRHDALGSVDSLTTAERILASCSSPCFGGRRRTASRPPQLVDGSAR